MNIQIMRQETNYLTIWYDNEITIPYFLKKIKIEALP